MTIRPEITEEDARALLRTLEVSGAESFHDVITALRHALGMHLCSICRQHHGYEVQHACE